MILLWIASQVLAYSVAVHAATRHTSVQPSPLSKLPSSHSSPNSWIPFPQTGSSQANGAEALVPTKAPAAFVLMDALPAENSAQNSSSPTQNSIATRA